MANSPTKESNGEKGSKTMARKRTTATAPFRLIRFAIPTLASLLAPFSHAAAASTSTSPAAQATTKSYHFKLSIGMSEQMWTPAQVKAKHPKTGEEMLMGSMSSAMSMHGSQRHLEVFILSRSTGKPVAGAHPTISALDTSVKNAMPIKVPVAEMEGVLAGSADLHYGNNVTLVPGHAYAVTVVLNGQRAILHATAPK
jgi:hypothetical protein